MTATVLNLRVSLRQNLAFVFTALAIMVVVGSSIGFHTQIKNQLNAWKLLPEPERLTELYFNNPNNLSASYTPGQSQKISFTVHNIEYQTFTYKYLAVEASQDGKLSQVLSSNTFRLKQNQYRSVSFTGPLADVGSEAKIVIEIPTVNESIDYLISRSNQ